MPKLYAKPGFLSDLGRCPLKPFFGLSGAVSPPDTADAPALALFETWESPPIDRIRPAHLRCGHGPHSYKDRSPAGCGDDSACSRKPSFLQLHCEVGSPRGAISGQPSDIFFCLLALLIKRARVAGPPLRVLQRWGLMQPASRFSTRDRRPHRSHLYKERKGEPAPGIVRGFQHHSLWLFNWGFPAGDQR